MEQAVESLTPTALLQRILALNDPQRQTEALQCAIRVYAPIASRITTDDQLWHYVCQSWGVAIPRLAVCPTHVAPFTAFADAYFARDSMVVWEGSRGLAGKSFLLSLLGLTIACTRGGDVNILGGSGQQSQRVHTYMSKAWESPGAPRGKLRSDPLAMRTRLDDGTIIQALLASSTSVMGPHCPTLLLDEVDEFSIPLFDAALGQTMSEPGRPAVTVMSSTHQYPDACFSEVKKRAAILGWKVDTWCYRETLQPHGWLAPSEVDRKRREVPLAMFRSEYDLQEPSPESRAIDTDAVTACFQRALGEYEGKPREYVEHEPPVAGASYAHGADWARQQDWSEILSLRTDTLPYRLVAYERMQRLPWPQMVGRFDARLDRYPTPAERACHDRTGIGDVVEGYMAHDAEGVILAGRARADLFANCVSAIERGEIISPWITALEAQIRYCTVDDLYGSGHPPDGFVALALAYRGAKAIPPPSKRAGAWGS